MDMEMDEVLHEGHFTMKPAVGHIAGKETVPGEGCIGGKLSSPILELAHERASKRQDRATWNRLPQTVLVYLPVGIL